jgi:MFS transporter, FSR family, fosmidomycin resistance protein
VGIFSLEIDIKKANFRSFFTGFRPSFVLAHFCNHMVAALPTPLMPLIALEFGLGNSGIGFVITAFSIASGLSQIPAGFVADRIGPRTMISVSICGIGLSGLLIGLSHNYIMMLVFLILLGIFGGGYHPSAPPLMAASVPASIRGKALGFHLVGGNAAFFLAPLMAAGLVAVWNWRGAFITLSIPTIIFGIVFYLILSGVSIKKKVKAAVAEPPPEVHVAQPGWVKVMVVFILVAAIVSSLSMSVSSFLSVYAVKHLGIDPKIAAILVAVFASSGVWASPFGGHLCDRIGYIPAMLLSSIVSGPFIFLITITPFGPWFIIVLLIWGALTSIRLPAVESYIVSQASPKRRSMILGIYYASSQHSTGILAPLVGYFFDLYDYVPVMQSVAIISIIICVIGGIFLWTIDRRSKVKAVEY